MIPKFRAWDKMFKEMVQVNALVLDEQVVKVTYKNGNVAKEDMKEYELMQSTGLKDKNNQEIFEGDILIVSDEHSWLEVVSYNQEKAMFVTEEINRKYKVPESPLNDLFDTNIFKFKVLGNIYENPELLEVENE
jgi:hypothetical protein|nr:MAG TPA: YopX protein [Caudoviricetes sp.]